MTEREESTRRVAALGELPLAIEPPRDLWPRIEAQLTRDAPPAAAVTPVRRATPVRNHLRALAAAAMVACVGVGVWLGRGLPRGAEAPALPTAASAVPVPGVAMARDATYVSDPRYAQQRAALLKSLAGQFAALPAPTRAKVAASLATVEQAKQELEQALGRDPGNALLQELLIDTYQDEMRVLTDVHEAGDAGRGI